MKSRVIIFATILLIALMSFGGYLFIKKGHEKKNEELFSKTLTCFQKGGQEKQADQLLNELLARPFLNEELRSSALTLLGISEVKKDDLNKALTFFKQVKISGSMFEIRDYIAFLHGELLYKLWLKEHDENILSQAEKQFNDVLKVEKSPKALMARFYLIQSKYEQDSKLDGVDISDSFIEEAKKESSLIADELTFMKGDSLVKRGDREEGLNILVRLYQQTKYGMWKKRVAAALNGFGESKKLAYPMISALEYMGILEADLAVAKKKTEIQDLKAKAIGFAKETAFMARDRLYRESLDYLTAKIMVRLDDSRGWHLMKGLLNAKTVEVRCKAAYDVLMKFRMKNGQEGVLWQVVRAVQKEPYRLSPMADKIIYSCGYPYMRKKQFAKAAAFYKVNLEFADPDKNEYFDDALWRLHWCTYHQKQYEKSLEILGQLSRLPGWEEYSIYWMAQIYMAKLQKLDEGRLYLEDLFTRFGMTYYGVKAGTILKQRFNQANLNEKNETFQAVVTQSLEDPVRNKRFETLKSSGLYFFAVEELKKYLEEKNITRKENYKDWRPFGDQLAKLYFYSGQYINAGLNIAWTYDKYIYQEAKDIPGWFWRIYYPLFYQDIIDRYAEKWDVNKRFLYAFIRQESFYEPYVKSPAGAIGVMQIMPGTGKKIYKEVSGTLGLRSSYTADMLFDPDINIPMGIYHLKKQLYEPNKLLIEKRNNTSNLSREQKDLLLITLTIAGYNAGSGASGRWLKEIEYNTVDEFIDQIDYQETRKYIKLVLKHEYLYNKFMRNVRND